MKGKKKLVECKECGVEIEKDAKKCQHCGTKNSKPIFKKWWFWGLIVLVFIAAVSGDKEPIEETIAINEETIVIPEDDYMISGSWAMYDSNYMFAVEVDGFDGDVFKAGKYKFNLVAGRTEAASNNSPAVLPAIFDIYVSNQEFGSVSEIQQAISEPQISIGGMGSEDMELEYELTQGQYVYIIPFEADYEPSGYVNFEIIQ